MRMSNSRSATPRPLPAKNSHKCSLLILGLCKENPDKA